MPSAITVKSLQHVLAGTPADEVSKIIQADGGVIIEGLFAKQVDRFNAEMDPIVNEWAEGSQRQRVDDGVCRV